MKKNLLVFAMTAITTITFAQARDCSVAAERKVKKHFTDYSINILESKGYSLRDNKEEALFYLTQTAKNTYYSSTEVTITHIESGMQRQATSGGRTGLIQDSARGTMANELASAQTIYKYEEVKAKWKDYKFVDIPALSDVENAIIALPDCQSFYGEENNLR